MRQIIHKARSKPKRVVFGEGETAKIIRAAAAVEEQGIGKPILLGRESVICQMIADLGLDFVPRVVNPRDSERFETYSQALFEKRQRKGLSLSRARTQMRRRSYYGPMMVEMGDADAYVSGVNHNYPEVIRPALEIIGTADEVHKAAGMYIMIVRDRIFFFADPTVNIDPSAEDLAEIAIMASDEACRFDIEPRIAMISFSNFGSTRHPFAEKVQRAVEIVNQRRPELVIDGEMMADTAVVPEIVDEFYPFSRVRDANVLVFPNLEAANVAYKLLQRLGNAEAIGPVLMGIRKPVHLLQRGDEVRDIVNIAALAVVDAQERGD
jgi:malate dehydrogenase (oxaloacetate-decarboxylating)(NADP+)